MLRIHATVRWVEPASLVRECRDPGDDMILEAALATAQAHSATVVIVSDDRDLLTMDPERGVRIMNPEAVLAVLDASRT